MEAMYRACEGEGWEGRFSLNSYIIIVQYRLGVYMAQNMLGLYVAQRAIVLFHYSRDNKMCIAVIYIVDNVYYYNIVCTIM